MCHEAADALITLHFFLWIITGEGSASPLNEADLVLAISFPPVPRKHTQIFLAWTPCRPPASVQLSPDLYPKPLGRCPDLLSHCLNFSLVLHYHHLPPLIQYPAVCRKSLLGDRHCARLAFPQVSNDILLLLRQTGS